MHAVSKSFFGKNRLTIREDELRRDAWKWENCLHAENSYSGRTEGHDNLKKQQLTYALIISVKARRITDLYNPIVR
jgi:hypothetical protein